MVVLRGSEQARGKRCQEPLFSEGDRKEVPKTGSGISRHPIDTLSETPGAMLLRPALFVNLTRGPIQPRAQRINPACRADQPECNLHLRLFRLNCAPPIPHAVNHLRLLPRLSIDVTRSAHFRQIPLPKNAPRKRTKIPIFQGPNVARANSLCRLRRSETHRSSAIIPAEIPCF